jgi:hypothetical protein
MSTNAERFEVAVVEAIAESLIEYSCRSGACGRGLWSVALSSALKEYATSVDELGGQRPCQVFKGGGHVDGFWVVTLERVR